MADEDKKKHETEGNAENETSDTFYETDLLIDIPEETIYSEQENTKKETLLGNNITIAPAEQNSSAGYNVSFFARYEKKLKFVIALLFALISALAAYEIKTIKKYESALAEMSSANDEKKEMPAETGKKHYPAEKHDAKSARHPLSAPPRDLTHENNVPNAAVRGLRKAEIVSFGRYPQTSRGEKKPIEWIVLSQSPGGEALLLSRYALEAAPFNMRRASASWEHSSIRKWLNSSFLDIAFTDLEREQIIYSHTDNKSEKMRLTYEEAKYWSGLLGQDFSAAAGKEWNTPYYPPTRDKVFLLSASEAASLDRRKLLLKPTDYALTSAGGSVKMAMPVCGRHGKCAKTEITGTSGWWLRTPGIDRDYSAFVYGDKIFSPGTKNDYPGNALRPAIRVENIYGNSFTVIR